MHLLFSKKVNLISHLSKKIKKFILSKRSKNLKMNCVTSETFDGIIKTRYVDSNTASKYLDCIM